MIESPVKTRVDPREYRKPMTVSEWVRVEHYCLYSMEPTYYPVCPRCKRTFEREYQKFCDRCGQRLAWKVRLKKPR